MIARALGLEGAHQWFRMSSQLHDQGLPDNPHIVYANEGFIDYADFLGIDSAEDLSRQALKIEIKKLQFFLRLNPEIKIDKRQRKPVVKRGLDYEQAKGYISSFKLRSKEEFLHHVRSRNVPEGFPRRPDLKYTDMGWTTWAAFLGTDTTRVTSNMISFEEAKAIAQSLNLRSKEQWQAYIKENGKPHPLMPYEPQLRFKSTGWVSWRDFLGVK